MRCYEEFGNVRELTRIVCFSERVTLLSGCPVVEMRTLNTVNVNHNIDFTLFVTEYILLSVCIIMKRYA